MKKKIISLLLATLLLIGLLPVVAMAAENTAAIQAFNAAGDRVASGTNFTSIDAAAAVAGEGGTVRISGGAYYFSGRQTISVNGITLEGVGSTATTLYASSAFSQTSDTNRKALLTIDADNVTVKNLTLDGSPYGSSLSQTDDFIVVRINEGNNIALNNVSITGSKRTLLHVGTSDKTAAVTAEDLICEAEYKSLPSQLLDGSLSGVYADIEVNPGSSLTVESGTLDAFAKAERNATLLVPDGHYELRQTVLFGIDLYKITTTAKHFVESYEYLKNTNQLSQLSAYRSLVNAESEEILNMAMATIKAGEDQTFINAFVDMLNDVIGSATTGSLIQARNVLQNGTLPTPQPGSNSLIQFISQMILRYLLPILQRMLPAFR